MPSPAGVADGEFRDQRFLEGVMNMKMLSRALLILAVFGLAACSNNPPVYNVESAQLNAPAKASLDDIQRAILSSGLKRGWMMNVVGPGHIEATHTRQNYSAKVDIRFDKQTYSITYKDSQHLSYDGSTVHPTYNRWIQYLQQDIAIYVQAI
jgi:hypothetical protein